MRSSPSPGRSTGAIGRVWSKATAWPQRRAHSAIHAGRYAVGHAGPYRTIPVKGRGFAPLAVTGQGASAQPDRAGPWARAGALSTWWMRCPVAAPSRTGIPRWDRRAVSRQPYIQLYGKGRRAVSQTYRQTYMQLYSCMARAGAQCPRHTYIHATIQLYGKGRVAI